MNDPNYCGHGRPRAVCGQCFPSDPRAAHDDSAPYQEKPHGYFGNAAGDCVTCEGNLLDPIHWMGEPGKNPQFSVRPDQEKEAPPDAASGEYRCRQCGTVMNEGEGRTFTVCGDCWPVAEAPPPEPSACIPLGEGFPEAKERIVDAVRRSEKVTGEMLQQRIGALEPSAVSPAADLAAENAALRSEVERLESELSALRRSWKIIREISSIQDAVEFYWSWSPTEREAWDKLIDALADPNAPERAADKAEKR